MFMDTCNHVEMPNIDETAKAWQSDMAQRFGEAVAACRKDRGIKAAELADRTRDLGYPIHRVAITKIETNSRGGKVDLAEVMTLALALGVPPVQLIYPNLPDGPVEVWPGFETSSIHALQWFSGDIRASDIHTGPFTESSSNARVQLAREYDRAREVKTESALEYREIRMMESRAYRDRQRSGSESEHRSSGEAALALAAREAFQAALHRVAEIEKQLHTNGWPVRDA